MGDDQGWARVLVGLSVVLLLLAGGCARAPTPVPPATSPSWTRPPMGPAASTPSPSAASPPSRPPPAPAPGSLAYLDFRNGFRDLKFGDPYPQDMRLIEESGEAKYYTRTRDDLTIGRSTVKDIVYGFYRERLYAVLIHTEGYANSRALLEVLREAYGPGARPNRFMETYYWNGAHVWLSYEEKPLSHEATVIYTSVPLSNEKKAEEKAQSRKGVSGL